MMRSILIKAYSLLLGLFICPLHVNLRNAKFWLCNFKIARHNTLSFIGSYCSKTIFSISGNHNKVNVEGEVFHSSISVVGDNNEIVVQKGSKIYNASIILRGNHCQFLIGQESTIGSGYFVCMGKDNFIKIGKECMIADGVEMWATDSHPIYDKDIGVLLNPSRPIQIGNHVWIGKKVTILKGVDINDHAVVGMNSLVTKSLPSFSLSVGNPNRVIKENVFWKREYISE